MTLLGHMCTVAEVVTLTLAEKHSRLYRYEKNLLHLRQLPVDTQSIIQMSAIVRAHDKQPFIQVTQCMQLVLDFFKGVMTAGKVPNSVSILN